MKLSPWKIREIELKISSRRRQRKLNAIDKQRVHSENKQERICRIIKRNGVVIEV